MTHQLFTSITLRSLEIRNRLWAAPMCQYMAEAEDGIPTPWHLVHLGSLARGGVGAVFTEATAVTPEGRITPQDLGIWSDQHRSAFMPVVDFIHSQGASAGIQLAHAGRKASVFRPWEPRQGTVPQANGGWNTVGPSDVAYPGFASPTQLDAEGIRSIVRAFAAAAGRAVDAGFDLIELHAAHGYLIHQFLSPLSNTRTDEFGGSLENRSRFLLDIIEGVRDSIPHSMPLIVRVSATDWVEGGWTVTDTEQVAQWAAQRGTDLIDVSSGGSSPAQVIPVGPGYQVPFATSIRAASGIPTIAVGMIDQPHQAEQVIATGLADIVMVGRELLRDPNFPFRAAAALRTELSYAPQPYHRAPIS
ncbi:NADH:flavin oxidoreductase/NADH oxidase [Paenarthrobacter sp. MSM-2-10-13]|uniref:NADH:flavin oxidoreductase/NADH oxidase n=1 Tax=Micrococcaceae TaxID=1268 RepID=UPI00141D7934|nr:NADH:flavin oxidoreductase/NADH oxidase [Paenarthrobacter sp. MSM-2-10-13]NHW47545.1 NADH:flavin oxidoreductase/NADH oxidase [Paenarthrobacter sp. MSM-2-10-13]BFE44134.1 NADH:flavin oxidoreductase/NADH oxidase [Pseudarthrobacter oxydans]